MKRAKQNLTVALDPATIRRAKRLAVERDCSISALVAQQIEKLVDDHGAYELAKRRALELLETGIPGTFKPMRRAEFYDQVLRRHQRPGIRPRPAAIGKAAHR